MQDGAAKQVAQAAGSLASALRPPMARRLRGAWAGLWAAARGGLDDPLAALDRAQLDWVLWAPLALGLGVGLYFALPAEPGVPMLAALELLLVLAAAIWARSPGFVRLPVMLLALVAAGLLLAAFRANSVAAPVLARNYYGPVEGRIVAIDRSARDVLRLTLDQVRLERIAPENRPAKVRIALHGDISGLDPEPGLSIMTTAHLSPPAEPIAPGAWDFRRNAWFEGLGALGYTRSPVLVLAPPDESDWSLAAHRFRMRLSAAMQARIGGQAGAVSAALMTGDRSGISEATNAQMRASNLYHIVSISGLHMGMLAGFVFAALRYGLAMLGNLALHWPTKKIAAAVALAASTLYLWISGADIATQRAWIMTAVMLAAILVDRRALSLHTVALAALFLLVLWPETLTGPGFQMSFAATVALILVAGPWLRWQHHIPALARPAAMLVLTSLLAGLATAPIAAAHFGRMSQYGILANLLAVPVMGMVVMPAGVVAAVLAPLGLAGPALWLMGKGTDWVLMVSEFVAGLAGAQSFILAPPAWVLPLMALAAGAAVLASGALRALACALVLACGIGWGLGARPALLIAPEGALVGLMTPEGRALSKAAPSFAAEGWLEADGDAASPKEAMARDGFGGKKGLRTAQWQGRALVHLSGKRALDHLAEVCRGGALVVLDTAAPKGFTGDCSLYDTQRMARSGAVSFDASGAMRSARAEAGRRLWTLPPRPKPSGSQ